MVGTSFFFLLTYSPSIYNATVIGWQHVTHSGWYTYKGNTDARTNGSGFCIQKENVYFSNSSMAIPCSHGIPFLPWPHEPITTASRAAGNVSSLRSLNARYEKTPNEPIPGDYPAAGGRAAGNVSSLRSLNARYEKTPNEPIPGDYPAAGGRQPPPADNTAASHHSTTQQIR